MPGNTVNGSNCIQGPFSKVLSMQDVQAEKDALQSGRSKQPLGNSISVNGPASKVTPSQPDCLSIAGALPQSLLTPAKATVSKPPLRTVSAVETDENTPPHAAVSPAIKRSLCETQPSLVSSSTPFSL